MRLTFFGLTPHKIEHSSKLIHLIKKIIKESENGSFLSDITDVIPNSDKFDLGSFNKFSVFKMIEKKGWTDPRKWISTAFTLGIAVTGFYAAYNWSQFTYEVQGWFFTAKNYIDGVL